MPELCVQVKYQGVCSFIVNVVDEADAEEAAEEMFRDGEQPVEMGNEAEWFIGIESVEPCGNEDEDDG